MSNLAKLLFYVCNAQNITVAMDYIMRNVLYKKTSLATWYCFTITHRTDCLFLKHPYTWNTKQREGTFLEAFISISKWRNEIFHFFQFFLPLPRLPGLAGAVRGDLPKLTCRWQQFPPPGRATVAPTSLQSVRSPRPAWASLCFSSPPSNTTPP